jgi:two-component system, sensor histidine kinase PhcS
MAEPSPAQTAELYRLFLLDEQPVRVQNFRLACVLGGLFTFVASFLDALVYPAHFMEFFELRLACSALIAFIWWLVKTPLGLRHYQLLGLILPALPTFFISIMIYRTDGAASSYYGALNLVLLGAGIVLRWTFTESIIVFLEVLFIYLTACLAHGLPAANPHILFTNGYFLLVTGFFVVIGSHFYNRLRFREFTLRHQLNQQNEQLDRQNRQIKEAEAQLVQTEKLASLGRMSAGIIHEINNPLNFVKTGLYTLNKQTKHLPAERQADYADTLKDLEDGFDRVMTIVSSLRGFTHHDDETRDAVPVAALVDESIRFVSHEWSSGVQLEKDLAGGQTIYANKNKLIQVCLNLLENALDALKTKTFPAGESPVIRITSRVENGKNLLIFRDNGPGIPPENLGKIFDPFFTTKDVGEGMGMGLSICYRIIRQFDGDIRVQSEPGKYCEFTLEFPVKA